MSSLKSVAERLSAVLHDEASTPGVAGAVVGVAVGEEELSLAHGTANLNTGYPFTEDTGWLLGSVTKVLTTTVLMRLVERGRVDLDATVQRYVPEFALRDVDAAERISVRMLLNHTNGIDADTLMPAAVRGRDASRSYTEHLPRMGVLFEPGAGIHYSNPGFVLAARVIEECTGEPFETAMQRELFDPAGMRDATALQTQAFLRRTAVGAVADPGSTSLRAAPMFTLPESAAGAGATPIVTVADMLAFGRMHLRDGVAPNGTHVLGGDLVKAMRSPTYDLGIPQAPPIGLGWWLTPIAGTTAGWHGGGSPGGASSFCIIPEYDATVVSFATGPGTAALNDLLHNAVVEELSGRSVTPPLDISSASAVQEDVAGEYGSFQLRTVVDVNDDDLVVTNHFEPYDDEHRQTLQRWGTPDALAITYTRVAPGQFFPAGMDPTSLSGFYGRMGLLANLPAGPGRRPGLQSGLRYTPKIK